MKAQLRAEFEHDMRKKMGAQAERNRQGWAKARKTIGELRREIGQMKQKEYDERRGRIS